MTQKTKNEGKLAYSSSAPAETEEEDKIHCNSKVRVCSFQSKS